MSISPEEIEDIVYCSRIGEVEPIQEFFQECTKTGSVGPLELLIQIEDNESKSTALHMASANGNSNVVKFILGCINGASDESKAKSYVNSQNNSGNTALHWAALNGHLEVVTELCESGLVDPFIKNSAAHDVFYEADNAEKEPVINYLLQKYSIDLVGGEEEENGKEGHGDEDEGTEDQEMSNS